MTDLLLQPTGSPTQYEVIADGQIVGRISLVGALQTSRGCGRSIFPSVKAVNRCMASRRRARPRCSPSRRRGSAIEKGTLCSRVIRVWPRQRRPCTCPASAGRFLAENKPRLSAPAVPDSGHLLRSRYDRATPTQANGAEGLSPSTSARGGCEGQTKTGRRLRGGFFQGSAKSPRTLAEVGRSRTPAGGNRRGLRSHNSDSRGIGASKRLPLSPMSR